MSEQSLRELARQYASGMMQQAEYRRARAELLQSILDAEGTVPPLTRANYTVPPAEEEFTFKTRTTETPPPSTPQSPATSSEAKATPSSLHTDSMPPPVKLGMDWRIPAAAGSAVLVLIFIAVLWLPTGADEAGMEEPASDQPAAEAASVVEAMDEDLMAFRVVDDPDNEALIMLREFTESPNWDEANLDTFVEDWRALPAEQRDTALESTAARRLADLLNRRLVEERALSGGDSETWQVFEQRTLEFAEAVGIEDRRLQQKD